jgi:putative FmdB family regulatory protein
MPAYPYQCVAENCETSIEVVRSIHAKEVIPVCPTCGYQLVRVFEATPVRFIGGGFYSTGG